MSERVPVLKHHFEQIVEFYPGITDPLLAEEAVKNGMFPETRVVRFIDGLPGYPNMDEEAMAVEYAKLIVAVNTDNAEILPEWSSEGFKNTDGACGPCGNVVPSASRANRKMCNLWRRAAAVRSRKFENGFIKCQSR